MSVTQYAALRNNISRQHVLSYLSKGMALVGVLKSEKIGNQWILTVDLKNNSFTGSGLHHI